MKILILILLSAAFAQNKNTQKGCFQAMNHSAKTARACDGVGDKNLQIHIEELRRSAEVHATPKGKPVEMSEKAGVSR